MKKWLFNPFVYIAGAKSLAIGWAVMLITACICIYSHTHFDGVIDIHPLITPAWANFSEPLIDWASAVLVFYIAGRIFSISSVRLVDVAGTLALARWVMIFAALSGFGIDAAQLANIRALPIEEIRKIINANFILSAIPQVVAMIWMIALMYNAFTVSCNLKGSKATGVFISALILAEILSKIIIYLTYKNMI